MAEGPLKILTRDVPIDEDQHSNSNRLRTGNEKVSMLVVLLVL
jgi:hypothetical protein